MKRLFCLLILSCLLFLLAVPIAAQENNRDLVIFTIDRVSLNQIQAAETPNLDLLMEEGALGLMNTRTAGGLTSPNAYLTIGAGQRAVAGGAGNYSFNIDLDWQGRSVKELYRAKTANQPEEAEVVNIRLAELIQQNQRSDYQAQPGFLGDQLQEADKKIAVIGNSDYLDKSTEYNLGREAALLGMDSQGKIALGDIGQQTVLNTDQYPFIFLTDHSYLLSKFKEYRSQAELIIVESGDTARADTLYGSYSPEEFNSFKLQSLERVDNLLGKLLAELDLEQERIMVLTPTPAAEARREGQNLVPVILAGSEIESGLLTTSTIRRTGLISNLDITPVILDLLGLSQQSVQDSIHISSSASPLVELQDLEEQIKKTFSWRPILIKSFILSQIVVLILAVLLVIFKPQSLLFLFNFVEHLLLILLIIPFFFLFSSFFLGINLYLAIAVFLVLSLIIAYLLKRLEFDNLDPLLITASLISCLLIIDLWTGARLIRSSVLGYSPIIGARFYGLGNEFMGMLIGAVLIGSTGLIDRFPALQKYSKYILGSSFFLVAFTIGHPRLGANFGGLITSVLAFVFTYLLIIDYSFNLKSVIKALVIISLGIVGVILADLLLPTTETTHIGQTVLLMKNEGFKEVFNILSRKLSMNLKLLRWTIWTQVVVAFIVILAFLFKYPLGIVKNLIQDYPYLCYGFSGVIWGSVVAMLVNDSGIVATATLLLFPVLSFVYLVMQRIDLAN
ncbi:hypothetical protein [Fuchsiella alkaliacetigena]|uniref:hypothetical protein n=1 Tax=Fuchsiella alkaliacetigena TaxID=957042 RepID=UPI00200A8201|nr:hypothetical protein [Fuchsiella alkaliacetigena]MCK8825088.1 hypothetical protein [Fuchsiella alkaliacetigena]